MASASATSPLIYLAASGAAAYCIFGLQMQNGFFDMLTVMAEDHPTRLPGSTVDGELMTSGNQALDKAFLPLIRFFYPVTTGENPRLSLFSFWFAGQVIALHTLLVLEGLRVGNRGRLIAYTTVWGCLYQMVPFGITMPVWIALWLWTSPIAKLSAATPKAVLAQSLRIGNADLAVVVHSIVWGYIVPSALFALPSSSLIATQRYVLAWQFFPLYVGAARLLFSKALQLLGDVDNSVPPPPPTDPKQPGASLARRLRAVYFPVLVATAVTHTLTLLWVFFPDTRPAGLAGASLDLVSLFKPVSYPGHVVPVTSAAEGTLALLHYDIYFGGAAMLFWAIQVHGASTNAPSMASVLTALAGPGGAALALVWRRDEHLLLANTPKEKDN